MSISQENINTINFGSISAAGADYRTLENPQIGEALNLAKNLSPTRAYRLARGVLATVSDRDNYISEAGDMVSWAKQGNSEDRTMVCRAIRNDGGTGGEIFLIHQISGMTRSEARPFMLDYFDSGGDMKPIIKWLSAAGSVLQKHRVKDDNTAGVVINAIGNAAEDAFEWVGDTVGDAIDSIGEAISSVVDAVVNAGRAIGEFIEGVVSWTVSEVGDLISALVEAGQGLLEIITAAVEASIELTRKFVRAMIDIGYSVGQILVEAATLVGDGLRLVVDALMVAGQAVANVVVWAVNQVGDIAQRTIQALLDVGRSVLQIVRSVVNMTAEILRATVEAIIATGRTIGQLLVTAITQPQNFFDALVRAGRSIVNNIGELFDSVVNSVANGIQQVAESLARIGHSLLDLASWAVDRGAQIVKDVVSGILSAGKMVIDLMTAIASRTVAFIADVTKALIDIGHTVINLTKDVITLGLDTLRRFLNGLKRIADGLVRFAVEVARLTYRAAEAFIGAMIDVGLAVAEIMATTVSGTYWMFRRVVNAVIRRTGRFGQILDWVLTQAENRFSELWEDALQAARFAGQSINEAVAWAVEQSDEAFEAILNGWETMGERLSDFYNEAIDLAQSGVEDVFERIGRATVRLENSVLYAFKFLEKDFLPGMADFMKGLLDTGYELTELVIDLSNLTAQAAIRGFRELIDLGHTFSDLLAATMRNPENALDNLLTALDETGMSLRDIYQTVIVETSGEYEAAVTETLRDLGRPLRQMLDAAVEVGFGAIGTVVGTLLNLLASYRPMTNEEIATAQLVYGDTFDYSRIYFSQESLSNDIIFAIQDWNLDPSSESSRAFVTNSLVNFDINDGQITNATMIHELCHVWQFQETGPFYMAEAVHAQEWGDGYNYGYNNSANGDGGEDDLLAVFTDNPGFTNAQAFEEFNREQQADILEHFYVRLYEESPALDVEAWRPFHNLVHS
ncbi:hypothetical protein [Brumimicrobium mesophilum]|uniref:hypothetical protein n=1 Tax=Brumimicrobium mesophilum TaxID=392717 RepID=UPI000D1428C7|nr:hypothetical protein [Brumimicrobium mesophilum]